MNSQVIAYPANVEAEMVKFYNTLSELNRRHYAAVESSKLGYGGKAYIIRLLGIRRNTLCKGIAELQDSRLLSDLGSGRQRRSGGGRKKKC
jgi:hypothetical protein